MTKIFEQNKVICYLSGDNKCSKINVACYRIKNTNSKQKSELAYFLFLEKCTIIIPIMIINSASRIISAVSGLRMSNASMKAPISNAKYAMKINSNASFAIISNCFSEYLLVASPAVIMPPAMAPMK